ncbi:hypothetical protein ACNFX6_10925 [Acinetobacter johnsonii]|uniref:hypothetical protein n=1 Tax=Acinetobacter johnsonii TaxID=40214 RepID=UPI003CEE5F44
MDIQKEKIAHEKHLLSQGVDFKYLPNIQYSELENVYELIEWDEEYSEALNEINSSWCTWQAAKAQAVPEGFVLVKKVHPDAIVHNQGLGLFKECQIIYGWDGKSKDFKDALNKGFYHGVKLGAKAVLETAMIEAQEQSHECQNP